MSDHNVDFYGAKVCLFIGDKLLVILRDDDPTIVWPAYWDFPGGGREGQETPFETAARETMEEVGLELSISDIVDGAAFPSETILGLMNHFFLARLPVSAANKISLGDEGQKWAFMTPQDYAAHPKRIPHFAERMAQMLAKHPNITAQS